MKNNKFPLRAKLLMSVTKIIYTLKASHREVSCISNLEGAIKEFWDFGSTLDIEIDLRKCKNKNI